MMNICGCLVHAMPEKVSDVITAIEAFAGCEVHAEKDGRIVVTVEDVEDANEDTGMKRASDQIMEMHNIPGVITVTLSYHHFEANDADASTSAQAL